MERMRVMNRKITALTLSLALALSATACGSKADSNDENVVKIAYLPITIRWPLLKRPMNWRQVTASR